MAEIPKKTVWEAIAAGQSLPQVPDINSVYEMEVTPQEVYHLLQRWAYLEVWDVNNLALPSAPGKPLTVVGASPLYNVYNCGSKLVAGVRSLEGQQTLRDSEMTAASLVEVVLGLRAEAQLRGKENWQEIQLGGLDRMVRVFWVEAQVRAELKKEKPLEILHYDASQDDLDILEQRLNALGARRAEKEGP